MLRDLLSFAGEFLVFALGFIVVIFIAVWFGMSVFGVKTDPEYEAFCESVDGVWGVEMCWKDGELVPFPLGELGR